MPIYVGATHTPTEAPAGDTTASPATESTAVSTPTNDATPNVVISVGEAGTIAVGGTTGCGLSSTSSMSSGSNTVTLSTGGDKAYTCTITFTDCVGNQANGLSLTAFTGYQKQVNDPTASSPNAAI